MTESITIDCLQYAAWSEKIFRQMRQGGVDAVHVTIAYHETFRETVANIEEWNRYFSAYPELIVHACSAADVQVAREQGRTAIIFGFQNCSPIEDDLGLVQVWHRMGVRFMQLSYNNQSLLATGCYEREDPGITRMGRQVIKEMNRVGMVIDMSHSSERSTLEAIEISERPIAITHANPAGWHSALRNKSDDILRELANSGGMIGFSFYPHHLKGGSDCTLTSFANMARTMADRLGIEHLGIGSDLCQDQPDSVVHWMRNGRWTQETDYGEGSSKQAGFPEQPTWFQDNRSFPGLRQALLSEGFNAREVGQLMGENWLRFFEASFTAQA